MAVRLQYDSYMRMFQKGFIADAKWRRIYLLICSFSRGMVVNEEECMILAGCRIGSGITEIDFSCSSVQA